jgi:hypothetical protein
MQMNWISHELFTSKRQGRKESIYFRIKVNDSKTAYSTGIACKAVNFDKENQEILGEPAKNTQLKDIVRAYDLAVVKLRKRSDLTPRMLWCEMFGKLYKAPETTPTANTLGLLCEMWITQFESKVALKENTQRTLETYQSYQHMIKNYFGADKAIDTFKAVHFEELRLHLRTQKIVRGHNTGKTFSQNYVAKILQHFKKLFEYAYQLEWTNKNVVTTQVGKQIFILFLYK